MTIELKPDQERIIQEQLATGLFKSVDEILSVALSKLSHDERFDQENRRRAVRKMMDFGERYQLSLGEPVTRQFLHEGHRY